MESELHDLQSANKLDIKGEFIYKKDQAIDFIKFNIEFDAELKTEDNLKTLNLNDMNGTFHISVN